MRRQIFERKGFTDNLCYAAKTNVDRNVINDAIFKKVIEETYSKGLSEPPKKTYHLYKKHHK